MSYTFIDGYGSIQSADSSVVSGSTLRQAIDIASVLSIMPVVFSGNASVSGTVGASIIGLTPVTITNAPSVSGTVGASIVGQLPGGTAVLGSVAALQGTNPWVMVGSVYGSGSVVSFQGGTQITSVVSTVPSSVLVGASIFGQLPAGTAPLGSVATLQGTNPWVVVGSVYGSGSVAAFVVGNSSVITVNQSSSILAVPVGSVITVFQNPSIVGTYAEDAASASGDKGVFGLNVRNDTLASVTSTDGDYSALTVGPSGEVITANAPLTKWVQGTADLRVVQGASVVAIAAQGSSIFTYITGVQLANLGSASVLVTLCSSGSTLGYTIAPAGGGSNIVYPNALKTPANGTFAASLSGVASVLMSAQGFIAKI